MNKIAVGGQAGIEGGMSRAPHAISIAVRKANGVVVEKEEIWHSISHRIPFFQWPMIRGSFVFVESLIHGLQVVSFRQLMGWKKGEQSSKRISWALAGTLVMAFRIGLLIFNFFPLT